MQRLTILFVLLMFVLAACAGDPTPDATEEPVATAEAEMESTEEAEMDDMEATEEAEMDDMEATEEAEMDDMEATEEAEMDDMEATEEAAMDDMEIATSWTCPEGFEGQELNIYNWSTYIAEDTVPNFEELCGVTVNYDTYESDEAMLTRIRQGNPGYDIVVPSGDSIAVMAREELLIPLDRDAIPNFVNLSDALTGAPYDPDNVYSVPYQWGTVGIGYNTETIPDGITTWAELFAYDGTVAWLDDRRAMFGVALDYSWIRCQYNQRR